MPEAQPAGTASYPGISVIGSGYWGKNLVRNYYINQANKYRNI
jgi:hypothetical protein